LCYGIARIQNFELFIEEIYRVIWENLAMHQRHNCIELDAEMQYHMMEIVAK
jgi:hypothetical protein